MRILRLLMFLSGSVLSLVCLGAELAGARGIWLSNGDGQKHRIGTIEFAPAAAGKTRFKITMEEKLEEYFLAMRPFRCLTGPLQRLCHFPVEREAQLISRADLIPLEYALLFMRTAPKSLHINPFNGIYYRMTWTGDRIVGKLHDVDMDPFITPDSVPVERRQRPIGPADTSPGDPRSHWLPVLTIE
jgi:hypothetical protein